MMVEIAHRVKQALELGDLFQARQLVLEALHHRGNPEPLGQWLGELACRFKQAGQVEQALELLERKCRLLGDPGDQAALRRWQREFNAIRWPMARKDPQRSSRATRDRENLPLRFQPRWRYAFPAGPLDLQETLTLPAPIIAWDLVIVFHESRQYFLGLDLYTGTLRWESGILAESLDFSGTPVYRRPALLTAVPGFLKGLSSLESGGPMEILAASPKITPTPYAAPLAWGGAVVFLFASHLLVYEPDRGQQTYYPLEVQDRASLRLPVVCNDTLYLWSDRGRVLALDRGGPEFKLAAELSPDEEGRCSAPCALGNALFFELVNRQGYRRVGCYLPEEGRQLFQEIPAEICDPEHAHLHFPPIAAGDGVVLCSDVSPCLYKARVAGEHLEILPITIRNNRSATPIDRVVQVYSTTLNSYLLSKSFGGFCVVNLLNGNTMLEVFQPLPWEMISQPIVYGNRVIFVCREGVACYEVS